MEISNLFDVSGRTAIVTGGSRGIGYMIAEGLVRNGAKVYITSRKAEELDQAAEQLGHFGDCVALPSDLSDEASMLGFVEKFRDREVIGFTFLSITLEPRGVRRWASFRQADSTKCSTSMLKRHSCSPNRLSLNCGQLAPARTQRGL